MQAPGALRPGVRAACVLGGGAAVAGGALVWRHQQRGRPDACSSSGAAPAPWLGLELPRVKLSAAAIEALAGAMGEVAQISLLYPLVRLPPGGGCW
jgi:hypothetical protein